MIFLLTCVYSFSNKSRKSFENKKTICIVYMDSEWTSQKQKKKPKIEVWVHVCDEVLVSGYNGDLFQFFQFFFCVCFDEGSTFVAIWISCMHECVFVA